RQKRLELVGQPLQESKTAKIPGRPIFDQLVQMIEVGKINGIVLLNPSRLSRNTVDTGRIIYQMDQGKLLEVVTPYQTFRNNPNDKFMLNLLCTQAKLENDNKSVNVKEALKLKAERGVFPGKARPGYKNNHEKPQGLRDISIHPVYFPIMRKLFDLALTGNYSIAMLVREAMKLGLRSSRSGKPIVKSAMYRLFRDPFFTGRFIYGGKLYQGLHAPMITDAEFNLLQDILDGKSKGKSQKHDFALNGIIKCGECHYTITAQEHTKKYKNGKSQVFAYYNCTKKGSNRCSQPYASTDKVEGQFTNELSLFEMEPEFVDLAYEALEITNDKDTTVNKNSFEALQIALDGVDRRIDNLVAFKISPDNTDGGLLSNTEFADRKRALMIEKDKIMQQISQTDPARNEWYDVAKDAFDFALVASQKFAHGGSETKKTIFKTIGLNPILLDQKLQYQLRFIFMKIKRGIQETKQQIKSLVPI
ncbi:recombinase family protein, partial [Candidatus Microgenomates bacterium]|nr:recombinase family protein [Candidatus Microgenomates bacterium]